MKTVCYTLLLWALVAGSLQAQAPSYCENLLVNGSFEAKTVPEVPARGFRHLDEVEGWEVTGGDADKLEIQNNIFGQAPDGNQYLEVASSAPTWVSQQVATQSCTCYELSFAYKVRPGWASETDVYWNDVRIDSLPRTSVSANDWQYYRIVVRGTGHDELTFRDVSRANPAGGGLIDDVSLCPVPCGYEGCCGSTGAAVASGARYAP